MLEFIAQNVYSIAIFAGILLVIGILLVVSSVTPWHTKYNELIGYCVTMTGMIILVPLIVGTRGS